MRMKYPMAGFFVLTFLGFAGSGLTATNKAEVILVRDAKPAATVILAQSPCRSAQLAVAELNYYIKKMTGAELPVVHDNETVSGTIVLVGESSFTRSLGLTNSDFQKQEYLIRTKPDTLILMGYDDQDKGPIDYAGSGLWSGFNRFASHIGTVYAVHDFLQRFCDIRWYLPTELGEVISKRATLEFSGLDLRRKPWTSYREVYPWRMPKSLYWWDGSKPIREGGKYTVELLSKRESSLYWLRHKIGGYEFQANHSFGPWKQRFAKTHPEYFSKNADGAVNYDQLCYSSDKVVKQIVADAKEWFKGNRSDENGIARFANCKGDYISLTPMDNSNWCKCRKCQEQLKPTSTTRTSGFSNGRASRYLWNFVNEVAREFQKELPDKKISALAYWQYYLPPEDPNFTLEQNVSVLLCRTGLTGTQGQKIYTDTGYRKEDIERWRELTPNLYMWEYYNFPQYCRHNRFPAVVPRRIAEDLRFQHSLGVKGMFWLLDCESNGVVYPGMAMDHINLYVTLRLADDISQDVEKILEEYYALFWGPAAKPMRAFFEMMEKIYTHQAPYANSIRPGESDWISLCPPRRIEEFGDLIKQAKELAGEEPYKSRVELIDNAVYQMMVTSSRRALAIVDLKRTAPARRVEKAPDLDRGLDDPIWHTTVVAKPFCNAMDTLAKVQTQTRVLYDNTNLFVSFVCDEPGQIKAEERPRDSTAIFRDDSVEVFVDIGDESPYRQFAVNAAGSFYDGKGGDEKWQSTARVRTGKTPAGWWAIFAIPLNELTDVPPTPDTIMPPKPGTIWRINFCRTQPAREPPERYTSWAPTSGGFHNPDKFGPLIMQKDINLINTPGLEVGREHWHIGGNKGWVVSRLDLGSLDTNVFHGGQASWRMGPGYLATYIDGIDPSQSYRLSVWIKTKDVPDNGVHLWVDYWKGSQALGTFCKRPITGGTHDWRQFNIDNIRISDPRADKAQVFLYLVSDKGTVWFDDVCFEPVGQEIP